jgi:hypothetical protein
MTIKVENLGWTMTIKVEIFGWIMTIKVEIFVELWLLKLKIWVELWLLKLRFLVELWLLKLRILLNYISTINYYLIQTVVPSHYVRNIYIHVLHRNKQVSQKMKNAQDLTDVV